MCNIYDISIALHAYIHTYMYIFNDLMEQKINASYIAW